MPEKENPHKGHRQRMLKKYTELGIGCFEDHEILEILLYSAYTRRNTNDIAHDLIKRFGSLNGVLNASYDDLCEVENVGPNAAAMLCFFKDFALRHNVHDNSGVVLDTSEKLRSFCHTLLSKNRIEVAHALFLDDSYTLISEAQISVGVTNRVEFDLKKIVAKALKSQSSHVVLVHNHPGGVTMASATDVAATRRTANALKELGIELVDHIIVNEESSYSMRMARMLPDIWNS
ncbi:MAG: DNA repair protein [Oscillospiraceae bacterium]|nr:DNA repair protein [Oscillospiraceae bacterium]